MKAVSSGKARDGTSKQMMAVVPLNGKRSRGRPAKPLEGTKVTTEGSDSGGSGGSESGMLG